MGSPPSLRALSIVASTEPVRCRSAMIAACGMSGNTALTISTCRNLSSYCFLGAGIRIFLYLPSEVSRDAEVDAVVHDAGSDC